MATLQIPTPTFTTSGPRAAFKPPLHLHLPAQQQIPTPTFTTSGPRAAFKPPLHLHLPAQHPSLGIRKKTGRGWTAVRRAGPSTSSYIFALALPLSLLIFTVFTSIRIADKLDSDYLEELELNQAIMEAEGIAYEDDDEDEDEDEDVDGVDISRKEDDLQLPLPAFGGTRIRNRPKRQV